MDKNLKNCIADSILSKIIIEIHELKHNTRSMLIVTHSFIEVLINKLVEQKFKHGKEISDDRNFSHYMKLILLHEIGIFTDKEYDCLNRIRKCRNSAVHNPNYIFTVNDLNGININGKPVTNLHLFCVSIITFIFNKEPRLFAKFAGLDVEDM